MVYEPFACVLYRMKYGVNLTSRTTARTYEVMSR